LVSSVVPTTETTYFVRHRRARRYVLRVDVDGRLRVTIPPWGSRREAEAFAVRHGDWVARQRARVPGPSAMTSEERRSWRDRAARELPARLQALAAKLGLTVSRVSIRNQRTRWGSCGHDGHICLNWRLTMMPSWVSDYVMVHELIHLQRMDHSPAYWKLVERACPWYAKARDWLRANGASLR